MWLICGILFTLNVLNLETKNSEKNLISFENDGLINMVDYEQIKFYAKMVAESQKGTVTIIFKAFLATKKLLKDTWGYKTPFCDKLNKTSIRKHKPANYFKEIQFRGSPNLRNFDI